MSFLISDALAEVTSNGAASQNTAGGLMSMLPMIILLVAFMYFMVIRPQSKKAKDHKKLIDNLQKGDEIITVGGILGKIEKLTNDFIVINIAENTNIAVQKSAISNIVPRGTIKTV
ncbi:MAG: preprotein translocase subunit YajC [Coxiellaceae bacterium]|jgi:preprotein translocase subunit YajC|nr:preprotein translocase subunit YajC [Coxiellaceae bacterium]